MSSTQGCGERTARNLRGLRLQVATGDVGRDRLTRLLGGAANAYSCTRSKWKVPSPPTAVSWSDSWS